MYTKYYVIDEFGDSVGKAWFDVERHHYVVQIFTMGKELTFDHFNEMETCLWGLGLDVGIICIDPNISQKW